MGWLADPSMPGDSDDGDDADLEAELLALQGGGSSPKKQKGGSKSGMSVMYGRTSLERPLCWPRKTGGLSRQVVTYGSGLSRQVSLCIYHVYRYVWTWHCAAFTAQSKENLRCGILVCLLYLDVHNCNFRRL